MTATPIIEDAAEPLVARAVNELDRYDRQKKIWGEEGQRKLSRAKVAIVGDSACAAYAAMPLVALGIGEIRLLGSAPTRTGESLLAVPFADGPRVHAHRQTLALLNPTVNILSLPLDLETRLAQDFLGGATLIVDATNNPRSKALVLDHAEKRRTPVLTTSAAASYAKLMAWVPGQPIEAAHLMPQYEGLAQSPLLGLLFGGLIAEEVKKFTLGEQNPLQQPLYYTQGIPQRFTYPLPEGQAREFDAAPFRSRHALVVGAGALGNIMAIALAEMGFGAVDYLDYDTVESTNLNRQVLFSDAVGLPKAVVLADKHRKMNPAAQTHAVVERFAVTGGQYTADRLRPEGYDVVFDLVDNLYARAMLSAYAVSHGIPLVSAASSPEASQVAVYQPDVTACMDHIFNGYYDRGRDEEIIRRQSCIAQADPSVIITNQVAAALAALETCALFDAQYGTPFNGFLKYATNLDNRLGGTPIADACACHHNPSSVPNLEIPE